MYRVLVVGNDAIITETAEKEKVFENSGFCVSGMAGSNPQALAMLRRGSFDLVVAAVSSPGVDGPELLEAARALNSRQPVILLSEQCDLRLAGRCIRLGAFDLISPRASDADLGEALRRAAKYLGQTKPAGRKELEKTAGELFRLMISGEGLNGYPEAVAAEYGRGEDSREVLSAIYDATTDRFRDVFPWVLMLAPPGRLFRAEGDEPREVFAARINDYAEKIKVFRLRGMKATVNSVCRYLVENMQNDLSPDAAAKAFGISKAYLSHLFSVQTGMSFHNYYNILKIEYAKHILPNSTYRIREISEMLGYHSVDYFTSLFRKYVGCTPTQYRKANPPVGD